MLEIFAIGGWCIVGITALGLLAFGLLSVVLLRLYLTSWQHWPPEAVEASLTRGELTLRVVRVCGACAPLLGLLGTIVGLVHTFEALMYAGRTDAVARGVAQALLTTAHGLLVAIPVAFLGSIAERRAERVSQQAGERLLRAPHADPVAR